VFETSAVGNGALCHDAFPALVPGSSYFERMRDPSAEHENEQVLNLSQRSVASTPASQPAFRAGGTAVYSSHPPLQSVEGHAAHVAAGCSCGPQCPGVCSYNRKVPYPSGGPNDVRTVVVQPAFNCGGDSFYLLPAGAGESGGALLVKK